MNLLPIETIHVVVEKHTLVILLYIYILKTNITEKHLKALNCQIPAIKEPEADQKYFRIYICFKKKKLLTELIFKIFFLIFEFIILFILYKKKDDVIEKGKDDSKDSEDEALEELINFLTSLNKNLTLPVTFKPLQFFSKKL